MSAEAKDSLSITVEIFRRRISDREEVIIEIYILLIQSFNIVKMHFYRIAIEGRKKFCRNEILVKHDLELFWIHPIGHL